MCQRHIDDPHAHTNERMTLNEAFAPDKRPTIFRRLASHLWVAGYEEGIDTIWTGTSVEAALNPKHEVEADDELWNSPETCDEGAERVNIYTTALVRLMREQRRKK